MRPPSRFTPSSVEALETRIVPATLDVTGGVLSFVADAGDANVVVLSINGSDEYVFNNSQAITLTAAATTAGFVNVNASIVRGPNAAVSSISMNLGDQNDTLTVQGLADPLTVNAATGADTITLQNAVTVNGALDLEAETITIGAVVSGATDVTLDADTLAVNASVNLTGTAIVRPDTGARPINLGTETAGSLSLTDAELDRFASATLLRIGSKIAGAITISAGITNNADAVSLQSGAGVATAGAGFLAVNRLAVDANETVVLGGAGDVVLTLAVRVSDAGADFSITDVGGFTIGVVDGITGLATSTDAGSAISLDITGQSITQAADAKITGNGLLLQGTGAFTLTDPANDVATLAALTTGAGGVVTYADATDLTVGTVNGVSGVTSTASNVTLTTLAGGLTVSNGDGSPAPDVFAGGDVTMTSGVAGSDFGITLATNAGVSADSVISLTADAMSLGAALNASGAVVIEALEAATTIALGSADAAGTLGLTDVELDRIVTGVLQFAPDSLNPITVTGAISPAGVSQFLEIGGGSISGTGGIITPTLFLRTQGSVVLTGASDVDTLGNPVARRIGPLFSLADADGFTLGFSSSFTPGNFTLVTFDVGTAAVNFSNTLNLTLSGTTPGTDQGQVVVQGGVTLTGGLNLTSPGTLAQGTDFVIVSNDGSDPITGTFTGLAEGAALTVGGAPGTISYVGGDGNDVVFTTLPGLTITLANGGKTATFRDVDGDLVTVKTTKGAFDGSEFFGLVDGIAGGGQLRQLTLDADFTGANITFSAKRTAEGGNGFVNLGFLNATGVDLGAVTIAGDLARIVAGTVGGDAKVPALKSLTVQSMGLLGVSTLPASVSNDTSTLTGSLPKFTALGDFRHTRFLLTGTDSGLGVVNIAGSFVGDGGDPSLFDATAGIGSVKIGGDIRHSDSVANFLDSGFFTDGAIGGISVKGSITGASTSRVSIEAMGQLTAPAKGVDTALKSLTVGGSVEQLAVAVGGGNPLNADASIGSISVGGDWIASSVVAGALAGTDAGIGTADDAKVTGGRDNPALFSTIGSFTVKGQAFGTATTNADMFGIVAERIGKAKVGTRTFAFKTGTNEAFFAAPTFDGAGAEDPAFDFTIREIGSTTPTPAFGGTLDISSDGKTATFIDADGDLVTVKRSAGTFVAGDFTIAANAAGGGRLTRLVLTAAPTTAPFDVSITAKPGPDGGNGFVNVGEIDAGGLDLGAVLVAGELQDLTAGNSDPAKPGLRSLTVHSLGELAGDVGNSTGIDLTGNVASITVRTNVRDIDIETDEDLGTLTTGGSVIADANIGADSFRVVKIGGSFLGSSSIIANETIGAVTIGGDVVGNSALNTVIAAFGPATPPAKGLAIAIGSVTIKGSFESGMIEAGLLANPDASIGKVSIGRAWLGGNLLAGVKNQPDGFYGDGTDVSATALPGEPARFSTISSIIIKGQAIGSAAAGDTFGIVAEQIGAATIGKVKLKFDKGERDAADAFALGPTGPGATGLASDFFLRELV